jgi:SAM-dependent methyltransferase
VSFYEQVYGQRWSDEELREVSNVWEILVETFFQPLVGEDARVLDIGCGFCHFLNHLQAGEKIGVDAGPDVSRFAAPEVRIVQTEDLTLRGLPEQSFDCIFISNFLEHLENSRQVVASLCRARMLPWFIRR